jgi:hypothetical protein
VLGPLHAARPRAPARMYTGRQKATRLQMEADPHVLEE